VVHSGLIKVQMTGIDSIEYNALLTAGLTARFQCCPPPVLP
jgi:hypothetical protein